MAVIVLFAQDHVSTPSADPVPRGETVETLRERVRTLHTGPGPRSWVSPAHNTQRTHQLEEYYIIGFELFRLEDRLQCFLVSYSCSLSAC